MALIMPGPTSPIQFFIYLPRCRPSPIQSLPCPVVITALDERSFDCLPPFPHSLWSVPRLRATSRSNSRPKSRQVDPATRAAALELASRSASESRGVWDAPRCCRDVSEAARHQPTLEKEGAGKGVPMRAVSLPCSWPFCSPLGVQ